VDNKRVLLFSVNFEKDAGLEKDAKKMECTWAQLERLAHNREGWGSQHGETRTQQRRLGKPSRRFMFW
jgi:hypothetical protein